MAIVDKIKKADGKNKKGGINTGRSYGKLPSDAD